LRFVNVLYTNVDRCVIPYGCSIIQRHYISGSRYKKSKHLWHADRGVEAPQESRMSAEAGMVALRVKSNAPLKPQMSISSALRRL